MSAEQDQSPATPHPQPREEQPETLTDLIDRMDREAFRRSLEQRDLRLLSNHVLPRR
jgi:phage head maturation protease